MERRCDTCTKLRKNHQCAVLVTKIGMKQDCFAWSNDPDWERKVIKAVEEYAGRVVADYARKKVAG